VDFTEIAGPLGDKDQLESLCKACRARSMGVLVDTVLNHMTNESSWVTLDEGGVVESRLPRYSSWDFHPRREDNGQIIRAWLGNLPDLVTESSYVRLEARAYLRRLVRMGVGGFRFDAAKHIEIDFWQSVLAGLSDLFLFGEFANWGPDDFSDDYLSLMDAYDFTLAATLRQAIGWGGDLRDLINPATNRRALSGTAAVTFVKGHDIDLEPEGWTPYVYDNEEDELLAYAYIFGRREGTPYVYIDKYTHPAIRSGLRFNNLSLGKTETWLLPWCSETRLSWRRGKSMLVALNKSAQDWIPGSLPTGLMPGTFRELLIDQQYTVSAGGQIQGYQVQARQASYLVREV
jgi:alpha-amylase